MINLDRYPSKELDFAITKFQALYRGYITRKYTVLPTLHLSPSICCFINNFLKENRLQKTMSAKTIDSGKKLIKWDHNEITLLLPSEDLVGSGAWKKCFSGSTVKIIFKSKKEVKQFASVWIKSDSKTLHELETQRFLYNQHVQQKPKNVYFLEPWEQVHKNIYNQRRLETTLSEPYQKALCLKDIARALIWIHQQGVVHGDVYLKNILVEKLVDDEGTLRFVAYLTDFGSAKKFGADCEELDDYVRWDACKCFAGINTPLMDWQGFIVTNIVSWFPEMSSYLKWEYFILTRKRVFQDICNDNFYSPEFYWVNYKSFNKLTPEESWAWNLFISICKKSAQLYLHFKHQKEVITPKSVEFGMHQIKAEDLIEEFLQFVEKMCNNFAQ